MLRKIVYTISSESLTADLPKIPNVYENIDLYYVNNNDSKLLFCSGAKTIYICIYVEYTRSTLC